MRKKLFGCGSLVFCTVWLTFYVFYYHNYHNEPDCCVDLYRDHHLQQVSCDEVIPPFHQIQERVNISHKFRTVCVYAIVLLSVELLAILIGTLSKSYRGVAMELSLLLSCLGTAWLITASMVRFSEEGRLCSPDTYAEGSDQEYEWFKMGQF
jgi:hypothetical protein